MFADALSSSVFRGSTSESVTNYRGSRTGKALCDAWCVLFCSSSYKIEYLRRSAPPFPQWPGCRAQKHALAFAPNAPSVNTSHQATVHPCPLIGRLPRRWAPAHEVEAQAVCVCQHGMVSCSFVGRVWSCLLMRFRPARFARRPSRASPIITVHGLGRSRATRGACCFAPRPTGTSG
jgi:hypothetical protein